MKNTKGEDIIMGILYVTLGMMVVFSITALVIFSIKMYNDEDVTLSIVDNFHSEQIFNVGEIMT